MLGAVNKDIHFYREGFNNPMPGPGKVVVYHNCLSHLVCTRPVLPIRVAHDSRHQTPYGQADLRGKGA